VTSKSSPGSSRSTKKQQLEAGEKKTDEKWLFYVEKRLAECSALGVGNDRMP